MAERATWGSVNPSLIKKLRLIPSPYLQHYFHRLKKVRDAQAKPFTRAEEVQKLEVEIFSAYADPACDTKPEALSKRGGGGYSTVAFAVMNAIYTNQEKIIVVNAPHQGAVRWLPDDAVLELPCVVNASGIFPIVQAEIPGTVWGLVAAVKNYEQLTVEAAVTGSRDMAELALLAHPLVGDYELAQDLLAEMLEANRAFLAHSFDN